MSVPASNSEPVRIHLDFPPSTARRYVSSRFGTICFWVVLALFFLLLAYLGLLAFTSYNGALQTSAFLVGPNAAGLGFGVAAVAIVGVCMISRPRRY